MNYIAKLLLILSWTDDNLDWLKYTHKLVACNLEDGKVFHIHTKSFIEKSPNPSAWEISNSEK